MPAPSSGLLPESEVNKLALVFISPAQVHMREVRPFSTANLSWLRRVFARQTLIPMQPLRRIIEGLIPKLFHLDIPTNAPYITHERVTMLNDSSLALYSKKGDVQCATRPQAL